MAKRYTIMVIPDLGGKPKTWCVSRRVLKIFVSLFFCVTVAVVFFTNRYITLSKEIAELGELRIASKEQNQQIKEFTKKVSTFSQVLSKLAQFDKKLRVITSLEANSNVAVGGANEEIDWEDPSLTENPKKIMNLLNDEIGRLDTQSGLQKLSFQELDSFFREQKSFLTSTPSIWPSRGWVTSGFGYRVSPFTGSKEMHEGIDIATRVGAQIMAPAEGMVVKAGKDSGFGLLVEIDHGYGVVTRYGHNSEIVVSVGDRIKRGQKIAAVGNAGRSTGPHLHYEVILHGIPINPLQYIIDEDMPAS